MMSYDDFKNPLRAYYFEKKQGARTTPVTISQNDKALDAVYTTWKRAYSAVGDRARPSAEAFLAGYLRDTLPGLMTPLELIIKIQTAGGLEEGNVVELCIQYAQTGSLVKEAINILCDNRQYERASQLLLENHQVAYASAREQREVDDLISRARRSAQEVERQKAEREAQIAAAAPRERAIREAQIAAQVDAYRQRREALAAQAATRTDHEPRPVHPMQRRREAAPARRFPINPLFLVMALLALATLVLMHLSSGTGMKGSLSPARGPFDPLEEAFNRLSEGRLKLKDMKEIRAYAKSTPDKMIATSAAIALVDLVTDTTQDNMLQEVLMALANIIEVKETPPFSGVSQSRCQALVEAGLVTRLINSLVTRSSPMIQLQLISIISHLTVSSAGAQAMMTGDFIKTLIAFLATPKLPVTQAQTLQAVANLAQSESAHTSLIQAGAMPLILAALAEGHTDIQKAALPALINLIRSEATAAETVRANGVEILGVSLHSVDFFIQQNAAIAFKNLATYNAGAAAIKGNEKVYRLFNTLALSGNSIVQPHASDVVKMIFVYSMSQPGAPRLPFAEQHRTEQPATPGPHA